MKTKSIGFVNIFLIVIFFSTVFSHSIYANCGKCGSGQGAASSADTGSTPGASTDESVTKTIQDLNKIDYIDIVEKGDYWKLGWVKRQTYARNKWGITDLVSEAWEPPGSSRKVVVFPNGDLKIEGGIDVTYTLPSGEVINIPPGAYIVVSPNGTWDGTGPDKDHLPNKI